MSKQEYRRIEDAQVSSALAFLNESGICKLPLVGVENSRSIQIAGVELCSGNLHDVENVENLF